MEQSKGRILSRVDKSLLVGLAGLEGMRAGHARPPVVDLQLSDGLWHGFSTVLEGVQGAVWILLDCKGDFVVCKGG